MDKIKICCFSNGHGFTAKHRIPLLVHLRNKGYNITCIAPYKSDAYKIFDSYDFICYEIALSRHGVNIFKEIKSLFNLYSIFKKERPNILINATIKPVLYGTAISIFFSRTKVVNLITGLGYSFSTKTIKANIIKIITLIFYNLIFIFSKKQKVVFQNNKDKKFILKNTYLKEKNTFLISGSGIDPNQFKLLPQNKKNFEVILAGRMIWGKGVKSFVDSAKLVKNIYPDTSFKLVGPLDLDSNEAIQLETIKEWEDQNYIEWMGNIDNMTLIYKEASVVVLPSHSEGLPKTLMEASMCGRPIITTNIEGCKEVLIDGVTGFLISIDNPIELADKIMQLIENKELARSMGKKGRKYIKENFSTEIVIPKLSRAIESVIA